MAAETSIVIRRQVADPRLMGVVTIEASDAVVAFDPALTPLQTIRLETKVANSESLTQNNIDVTAVAGATKIHLINRIELTRVENRFQPELQLFSFHRRHVFCAGAVTGFTGHTGNQVAGVKMTIGG